MGWIWTALGVIGTGLSALGIWLWKLASQLTIFGKDIETMKEDIEDMQEIQKEHEVKHNEIIDKIDESSKYLADEFRKNSENMREYFDKKYTVLEQRIYEQKK